MSWRGVAANKPLETFGTPKPLVSEPAQALHVQPPARWVPPSGGSPETLAVTATFGFGARGSAFMTMSLSALCRLDADGGLQLAGINQAGFWRGFEAAQNGPGHPCRQTG